MNVTAPDPPMMTSHVMTAAEVVDLLRGTISERTVQEWARTKRIPARKRGRTWLFLRREIEEWLMRDDACP